MGAQSAVRIPIPIFLTSETIESPINLFLTEVLFLKCITWLVCF